MPFTFSHPAVVLPLSYFPKKWRSMTGLIIGSVAPDFEKFIRMRAYDNYSHTWESLFYFNLPLSILLSFVFHLYVRNTLIDNLPGFLKQRLAKYKSFDWHLHFKHHYKIIIFSILAGAFSHILWDAFTHNDGRFVKWVPFLNYEVDFTGSKMKIYDFLQIITSFIGALVILVALLMLPRHREPEQVKGKWKYWFILTLIAFIIVVVRYIYGYHLRYFANLIISIISGGLLSLIITPWLMKKLESFRKPVMNK